MHHTREHKYPQYYQYRSTDNTSIPTSPSKSKDSELHP